MKEGYKTKGGESAIHKFCKKIIIKENKLLVPVYNGNFKLMEFKKCISEYEYDNKKIDVVGFTSTGKKIAIEIFYKHRVDNEKLNVLKKGFDYIIEICVEDDSFKTYKGLVNHIIHAKNNKRWLYLSKDTDIRIKTEYIRLQNLDYELIEKKKNLELKEFKIQKEQKEFEDYLTNKRISVREFKDTLIEYEKHLKGREEKVKAREKRIKMCEKMANMYNSYIMKYRPKENEQWWENNEFLNWAFEQLD